MNEVRKIPAWRVAVAVAATAALLLLWKYYPTLDSLPLSADATPRIVTPRGDLADEEKSTIELFERTKASVVYITTTERVIDPWRRNIFTLPKGTGSGFIWDDQGHVVTNFHVVADASSARVRLADGRDYNAHLVGVNPAYDIAVLRINVTTNRPPAVLLGTSHDLKVGQKVFAIGNPFGLDWTLTSGLVSALDRSLTEDNGVTIEHLIQTDAAINPGNSGGPLLDSAGRLIGINTAIVSLSGAFSGVGFAVPVDVVNRVVPNLIGHGTQPRPVVGIEVDEQLNQAVIERLGVQGVVILKVAPGSAAAAAGLRGAKITDEGITPADIVVAVNDTAIGSVRALLNKLEEKRVGETVRLSVLRDGLNTEITLTLQAAP